MGFTVATVRGTLSGMETREEVAHNLTRARQASGYTQGDEKLAKHLDKHYDVDISGEQLRRIHNGRGPTPDKLSIDLIWALSKVYGVPIEELSLTVAERLARFTSSYADAWPDQLLLVA